MRCTFMLSRAVPFQLNFIVPGVELRSSVVAVQFTSVSMGALSVSAVQLIFKDFEVKAGGVLPIGSAGGGVVVSAVSIVRGWH